MLPIIIPAQNYCSTFFNNSKNNYSIYLNGANLAFFSRFIDDDVVEDLFKCNYNISNDTLTVCNCYKYNGQFYYILSGCFKIIADGILESIVDFPIICKKGDIFYCKRYEYEPPECLSGSSKSWANGKKNGGWFYIDSLSNLYRVTYKDDVVIQKEFLMKTYNKNP